MACATAATTAVGRLSVSLLATRRSAAIQEFVKVAARIRAAKMTWHVSVANVLTGV
jgi:hypothetical protein